MEGKARTFEANLDVVVVDFLVALLPLHVVVDDVEPGTKNER